LLASRAHAWQALLGSLATRTATFGQYISTESTEGIKRGGSKQREREDTEHTLPTAPGCRHHTQKVPCLPPFAVMTLLMVTLLLSGVSDLIGLVRLLYTGNNTLVTA